MIAIDECRKIAAKKVKELFGESYLQENKNKVCITVSENDERFFLFLGFKTSRDCPNMEPNDIGWCVYAEIYVNRENGNVFVKDYQTEVLN